jgi:hypothetical protein
VIAAATPALESDRVAARFPVNVDSTPLTGFVPRRA